MSFSWIGCLFFPFMCLIWVARPGMRAHCWIFEIPDESQATCKHFVSNCIWICVCCVNLVVSFWSGHDVLSQFFLPIEAQFWDFHFHVPILFEGRGCGCVWLRWWFCYAGFWFVCLRTWRISKLLIIQSRILLFFLYTVVFSIYFHYTGPRFCIFCIRIPVVRGWGHRPHSQSGLRRSFVCWGGGCMDLDQ